MEKIWPLLVILAGLVAGTYVFWGDSASETSPPAALSFDLVYPYKILATNEVIGEVAAAVAGKHATVTVLLPPGTDPRTYTLDEAALAKVAEADYILINGRGLEANFETALRNAAGSKPIYGVADGLGSVTAARELSPGVPDPAVWLNVNAWKDAPLVVRDRLRAFDGVNQIDYDRNAGYYRGQLETLSIYASTLVVTIPERRRLVVIGDNLAGHLGLGTRLGIEAARPGVLNVAEARPTDARTLARLVDMIGSRAPFPIFRQHGLPNDAFEALATAAAAKQVDVVDAGELFTLVPGPSATYTGTYVGMMDHNLTLLTIMLGGTAPSTGLNGKLYPPLTLPNELAPADPTLANLEKDAEAAAARRQSLPTTITRAIPTPAPTPTPVATPATTPTTAS